MNILFLTNKLPPYVDGVGDYTLNLAKQFAADGHRVAIVCRDGSVNTMVEGVDVLPIVSQWDEKDLPAIERVVRSRGIEIISLQYVPHGFQQKGLPFGLVCMLKGLRRLPGVKIMTFFHEVCIERSLRNLRWAMGYVMMRWISSNILKHSDIVGTSIDAYKRLIHDFGHRGDVAVVPIASNIPEREISAVELQTLRQRIARDDEMIVGFFGQRDISTSLQAIDLLRHRGLKIRTLFIGKVNAEQAESATNVYRTGVLDVAELWPYLNVADVMILPNSSFKSGSLAAILRAARPVVTQHDKMTSERMIDGRNVVFADFESSSSVAESLQTLLCNAELRAQIGQGAKALMHNVTWPDTYAAYVKALKN